MRAGGTRARLARLRDAMREHEIAAYLVPSSDPHQSEYVPEHWARRQWMSGFTGSAGELVVGLEGGGLWTDGRYHLQAREQLRGSGLKLFPVGDRDVPTLEGHLAKTLPRGAAVGVDPAVVSMKRTRRIARKFAPAGVTLKPIDENLVDAVRGPVPGRRARAPVAPLPIRFSGESSASRLRRVRRAMRGRKADALVVTTLDAIAWLFNVRGSDVAYNPVVIAYAVVTPDEAVLHVDRGKLDAAAEAHLRRTVRIEPYAGIRRTLRGLGRRKAAVWIDPETTSLMCARHLEGAKPILAPSPIPRMKARKNAVELAGIRAAHRRDGAVMVRFLHWLERSVPAGGVTEMSAAAKLDGLRAAGERFRGLSFPTIAGYADHGAIIHYSVDEASDIPLHPEGLFLVDSGGTTSTARPTLPAPCSSAGGPPTRSATAIPGCSRGTSLSLPRAFPPARPGRGSIPSPAPRSGSRAGTTRTGPGTAWAPSSTCTRGRSRSATARPRCRSSPATSSRTSPATTSPARSASASRTWWRSSRTRPSRRATSCASTP